MGTNMYPSAALLGQDKDQSLGALPIDELIEKADGFAGVFPGKKYFMSSNYFFSQHLASQEALLPVVQSTNMKL